MNNSSTFTSVMVVIILVLLVGFGVWYFTARSAPAPTQDGGIHIDVGGDAGPDQGAQMPGNAPALGS